MEWHLADDNLRLEHHADRFYQRRAGRQYRHGVGDCRQPRQPRGTSSPFTLTIVAPSKDAVSYQINNGHNGFITFNAISLPASASWSVDLGGQPSYSLVVGGTVYVAASVNGNSQLSALSGANGATVWGPIAFAGVTGITYDNGKIFVTSGTYTSQGILTALDVATGSPLWSSTIPGSFATQSPPVASEGLVYTLDDGVLTAFNENTGAQVWQQGVSGTNGAPAATVDGIYVAPVCYAIDLQPAIGAILWTNNTGCSGGGGNTPAVGCGVMYAPFSPGYYAGNVYATETGTGTQFILRKRPAGHLDDQRLYPQQLHVAGDCTQQ